MVWTIDKRRHLHETLRELGPCSPQWAKICALAGIAILHVQGDEQTLLQDGSLAFGP